ncbi:TolC family protein [Marinicella meishanensis]|uniref:TolC family protein n=1 Tax=Marinicella meishanensis TaxID=2873263 RepID=UPI001CBAF5F1|nr:TolC family protein [Marinicella sp. NBU2979]
MRQINLVMWMLISSTGHAMDSRQNPTSSLRFEAAINTAIKQDPWLIGSTHQEHSLLALSVAAGQLPDPKFSIGVANLAADSFEFDQEPMTHLKLVFSQHFPGGQSRQLRQTQLAQQSQQFPWLRADRIGQITVKTGALWLDVFAAQESIRIIHDSRKLFENLVDVATSSYRTAWSKTSQLDVVQAELELTRLDDRLVVLEQKKQIFLAQMSQWLGQSTGQHVVMHNQLPELSWEPRTKHHPELFLLHPAVQSLESEIAAKAVGIQLAEQSFKPAWSVNLGYGYRQNDPRGSDRADLLSFGVQLDLPLFTANRQGQGLKAAVASHSVLLTEKEAMLRHLMALSDAHTQALHGLHDRAQLYREVLIPQSQESVEIALQAYANDEGTFNDVIRAQIAALDASLQWLNIQVDMQKSILQINYAHMTGSQPVFNQGESS